MVARKRLNFAVYVYCLSRLSGHSLRVRTSIVGMARGQVGFTEFTCCYHKPEAPPQPEQEGAPFKSHHQRIERDKHVVDKGCAVEECASHHHGIGTVAWHHNQQQVHQQP